MRASRRSVVAMVVAFTLAGCGSGGDSPDRAAPEGPTSTTPGTSAQDRPGVVLEEAGAQPRQPLVLRIAAGSTARIRMESTLGLTLTVDGSPLPVGALPGTRLVLEQRVDRVDADGTAHYSAMFRDVSAVAAPGVAPAVVTATQQALDELEGLRGTGMFDSRAGIQTLIFDTSGVRNEAVRSTIESVASQVGNLAAPFPSEPVGRGARWTTTSRATINGITMDTTTRYTLRSRNGDRYQVDVEQDAVAPPGPATIPNLPAGTKASIVDFRVRSSGQVAGELTRQLPLESTVTGKGDGTMTITSGSERGTLVQHLDIRLTVSPG